MKTVMRPRYYCDFCKKSGGGAHAMKMHEQHCTANPNRSCRMCNLLGGGEELPELIKIALTGNVDALREAAGGCAVCMLAAIRQAPWPRARHFSDDPLCRYDYTIEERPEAISNWDFKKESARAMEVVNKIVADERPY